MDFPAAGEPALRLRAGKLLGARSVERDRSEWDVEIEGRVERALAFHALCGPLAPGDPVWVNTTAGALELGTGGVHFIIAPAAGGAGPCPDFAGREAGHLLKLRYTPLQHRVCAAEEAVSPHHAAVAAFEGLRGLPVLATELLSQAAAAALAARECVPDLRVVLLWLDSAALPLAMSHLVRELREQGILRATVTTGQAFGGDFEAVSVYSGLAVCAAAAGAELIIASQGPGNAGTGTEYGFSGMSVAEVLHAADALGGQPVLAPRMSSGDPRGRHQGWSHHTLTLLRCLRVPVSVPYPPEGGPSAAVGEQAGRHYLVPVDPGPAMPAVRAGARWLTTMGRGVDEDPLFFRSAAAAGSLAALAARECRSSISR